MIRGKGIKRTETTESGMLCIRYGEIYTSYDMAFEDVISFIRLIKVALISHQVMWFLHLLAKTKLILPKQQHFLEADKLPLVVI